MRDDARRHERRFKAMPQLVKVKKSMARLLTVVHERKLAFQDARSRLVAEGKEIPQTPVTVKDTDSTWRTRSALPRPIRRPNTRMHKARSFYRALELASGDKKRTSSSL